MDFKTLDPELDEFAIALGLYHWLQHNLVGMDDKYKAFCELTADGVFKPSHSQQFYENIGDDSAQFVYDSLTDNNYRDALNLVLNYKPE